jgi:hypothetical protein
MGWAMDKAKSVVHLNSHAQPHSLGRCAEYVRKAVEAGGVTLHHHPSAKDYGPSLMSVGFHKIVATRANAHYQHQAGDVVVTQPITGHPHGHMAMFNGTEWISDLKEKKH